MDTAVRREIRAEVRDEMERVYHRAFVKVMQRTVWLLQAAIVLVAFEL